MFCLTEQKNWFELRGDVRIIEVRTKGSYLRELIREFSLCQNIFSNNGEVRYIGSRIMEN